MTRLIDRASTTPGNWSCSGVCARERIHLDTNRVHIVASTKNSIYRRPYTGRWTSKQGCAYLLRGDIKTADTRWNMGSKRVWQLKHALTPHSLSLSVYLMLSLSLSRWTRARVIWYLCTREYTSRASTNDGPRLFAKYAKGRENTRGVKKNYAFIVDKWVVASGREIMRVARHRCFSFQSRAY